MADKFWFSLWFCVGKRILEYVAKLNISTGASICGPESNDFPKAKGSAVCQLLRKNRGLRRSFSDTYLETSKKTRTAQSVTENVFRFPGITFT
jgi:hypothetical protein